MKIELPQVGESVTEGIIGKWLKQVGETVEKYDPLVEVVTDKVNMEMPSPVSGVLTSILAKEGETVPMGAIIAEIQVENEQSEAPVPVPETLPQAAVPEPTLIDTTGVLLKNVAPVGPTGSGAVITISEEEIEEVSQPRKRYSPVVQRLAEEYNVDLSKITGTGIGGRVTRKDVQGYIDAGPTTETPAPAATTIAQPTPSTIETPQATPKPAVSAGQDEERVPLTPIRRMIAENLIRSATQIPQAWSIVEVDVTSLVQRREAIKADFQRKEGTNITYLAFIVKAVAESLKENPLLNSSWDKDAIILKRRINIGLAMAAPGGLVVPVIHDADSLSIAGLAKAIDDLTSRARQGKLRLEDVQGGTFTVNNTGALGSVMSQPLVNPPQAAIMTTEAIVKRPLVINDAIAIRSMMNLCITFDHRVIDGAESSAFINAVKRRIEAIGPDTGVY